MIDYKLKIFFAVIGLIFIFTIFHNVSKRKLEFKSGFLFLIITLIIMLFCIFDKILVPIKEFLGFESISDVVFFISFICNWLIILSLGIKMSIQGQKITKLVQEVAILKKGKKDEKDN